METLRPCPFCGKKLAVELNRDGEKIFVLCNVHGGGCGASSGYCGTITEAIAAWNTRWRYKTKQCINMSTDYADTDEFICSNCGIHLMGWTSFEQDEDTGEHLYSEYAFRYCPNCGAKIMESE